MIRPVQRYRNFDINLAGKFSISTTPCLQLFTMGGVRVPDSEAILTPILKPILAGENRESRISLSSRFLADSRFHPASLQKVVNIP
jgi:hypothetical protein